MKTLICSPVKCENLYLREWVQYHKNLGFNKIVLYDNNDENGEHLEENIYDYIKSGFIDIYDYRGKHEITNTIYKDCYLKYGNEYDWIFYFDIDEFFTINPNTKCKTINELMFNPIYNYFDMMRINCIIFGDNNLIHYESKPVLERFIYPINFDHIDNALTKTILRGNLKLPDDIIFGPHCILNFTPQCGSMNGTFVYSHINYNIPLSEDLNNDFCTPLFDFSIAIIRHYYTKSLEEFIKKIKRGYPDVEPEKWQESINLDHFFIYNEKTPEKLEYLKSIEINYE